MRVLITGAFGNIGKAVLEKAYENGHEINILELETKRNRKYARKIRKKINRLFFGDINDTTLVNEAVEQSDAIIHLAAIIPPLSKRNRELCMRVNYEGTLNLLRARDRCSQDIAFIFTSSASVMGSTQQREPPVKVTDPVVITGNYEESKIKAEKYLKTNEDNYLIFRLAGVLTSYASFNMSYLEETFDFHPEARVEFVLDKDVATALVTAAEKLVAKQTPQKKTYFLGGGAENNCQTTGQAFLELLYNSFVIPMPERKYFTSNINAYHLDWYDTEEAQKEFFFQNHGIDNFFNFMLKKYGKFKPIIKLFKRALLRKITSMSPYNN